MSGCSWPRAAAGGMTVREGSGDFLWGRGGRRAFDGGKEPVVTQGGLEVGVRPTPFGDGGGDLLVEGRDVGGRARGDAGGYGPVGVGHRQEFAVDPNLPVA